MLSSFRSFLTARLSGTNFLLLSTTFALCLAVGAPSAMAGSEFRAISPSSPSPLVDATRGSAEDKYSRGGSPLDGLRGSNPDLRVDSEVKRLLNAGEFIDLLVSFEMPDLSSAYKMGWEDRGRFVHSQLERARAHAQRPLMEHFDSAGIAYESYLVGNLMVIREADLSVLQDLTTYRATRDVTVKPEWVLIEPDETNDFVPASSADAEPNLVQIRATDVWDNLGITGEGITVGLNDSPPRYTHNALVNAYRGFDDDTGEFDHNYNWFDPAGNQMAPVGEFHGTHVLGTMLGNDGGSNVTGVAIGAQWMACGGCVGQGCPSVLACLDFFVAPTDLQGANPDPDRRPQVVNNSWGDCGQSYNPVYESIWDSMYAAGVIPMISNGNAGNCGYSSPPGPNTVGNPARAGRAMGIGSTTQSGGNYATHSNWGPTDNPNPGLAGGSFDHFDFPDVKPNVVAPGQGIRSSTAGSDSAYGGATGTSMASPHASGVAALMMSAAPCLIGNHVRINSILMETASPIAYDGGPFGAGVNPDGVDFPDNTPNYATGWGEIDALAAVEMAIADCGPSGSLTGTVVDAETTQTLSNVQVQIPNPNPDGPANFNTSTNVQGQFTRVLPEGTYELTFSRFGYTALVQTVVVAEDDELDITFELEPADVINITGSVTDGATGWGLHALIDITGAPDSPYFTDPVTGQFSINLPETFSTEMTVVSAVPGYVSTTLPITVEEGLNVPVQLSADAALCNAPGYEIAGALFLEDFSTDGGFTATGDEGDWEWGTPTAWPNGCTQGDTCWGTNLSDDYSNNGNETLTSPVIDLSDASGPLTLTWDQANHIESSTWDQGIAQVSINGGAWQTIWEHSGATSQVDWRQLSADISAAAGGSIQLRWNLTTDGSIVYPGIFIDNIRVLSDESCVAPVDGSLLFGHVTDVNTGQGVAEAVATITGLGTHSMMATPDPSFDHGVFHVYMPGGFEVIDLIFGDRFEVSDGERGSAGFELTVRADSDFYTGDETDVGPMDGQTVGAFLALTAGRLAIQPASVTQSVTLNQTASGTVALLNTGTEALTFDATNVIIDTVSNVYEQDFEGDFQPLSGWSVENLGGDCDWARNDQLTNAAGNPVADRPNYAGGDGFAAAADSDRCGGGATMDSALISPPLDLSAVELPGYSFVLSFNPLGASRLDFDISTDGGNSWDTLQTWTGTAESPTGPGTLISGDLNAYADESDVRLRFRYVAPGWHWWAQIDQFRLTGAQQFVTATPSTGTIPAGGATVVNLDFDASLVDLPGDYSATFLIGHDTPYNDQVSALTVTMEVGPDEGLSRLEGQVRGLGYCDGEPINAAGATIEIQGQQDSYTLEADANGMYGIWLPTDEAPLTLDVSAAGHVDQNAPSVGLVSQDTTTLDFDLRLDAPCATITPVSSSLSLDSGTSTIVQAIVQNQGAGALNWDEVVAGSVPGEAIYERPDNQTNGVLAAVFPNATGTPTFIPADDVVVGGEPILQVFTDGFGVPFPQNLPATANALNFAVLADDSGSPAGNPLNAGDVLWSYSGPLSDPAFIIDEGGGMANLGIDIFEATGSALLLPAGTYWFAFWTTNPAPAATTTTPRWAWFYTDEPVTGSTAQIFDGGAWDTLDSDMAISVRTGTACGGLASTAASSGSVAPDDASILSINVDAVGVVPGNYLTAACIDTNDLLRPAGARIGHTIDATVTAPPSFGTIQGTVESSGYCDAESILVDGAEVVVDGATGPFTVSTNASGEFELAVDEGGYTITVNAPDHVEGVESVTVTPGDLTTQDFVLRLDAACASVDPEALAASVAQNDSTTVSLDVINSGAAAMAFAIAFDEDDGRQVRSEVEVVEDGGFEGGIPNAAWEEFSSNFGTPICDANGCGLGGGTGPNSGSWWTWFGGIAAAETGSVSQEVTIPSGSAAELSFFLEIPGSGQPGFMEVRLGGDVLFSVTEADAGSYATYQEVNLDVSAYADGGTYELEFYSETQAGASPTNFFIDDVSLLVAEELVCGDPAGISWLTATPDGGSVDADDLVAVAVGFNAAGVPAGNYSANLCLTTSDANAELIVVPVSMEVTPPVGPSANFSFDGFGDLVVNEEGVVSVNVEAFNVDPTTPVRYRVRLTDDAGVGIEGQTYENCNDGASCLDRQTLPATDADGVTFFGPVSGVAAGTIGILEPDGTTTWFAFSPIASGVQNVDIQLWDVTDPGDPVVIDDGATSFDVAIQTANVQIAHLAPFAADVADTAVNILVNGEEALAGVEYGASTAYLTLPAGDVDIDIVPVGETDPAISASLTLMANANYSVLAVGDGDNQTLDLIVLLDAPGTPEVDEFQIRLGHAAPFDSGLATADVRLANGDLVVPNVDFGDVTGFIALVEGDYDLTITAPGGDPVLIDPIELGFAAGDVISAFAVGDGVNQDLGIFAWPPNAPGFFVPLKVVGLDFLQEDFEDTFPPSGWENQSEGTPPECVWARTDEVVPNFGPVDPETGGRPNYAGGDGAAATLDSDSCGSGTNIDAVLTTPAVNLAGMDNPRLQFNMSFNTAFDNNEFYVDISTDLGASWTNLASWDNEDVSPTGPGAEIVLDLSDYDDSTGAIVRFRNIAGWSNWIQIDQVLIDSAQEEVEVDLVGFASFYEPGDMDLGTERVEFLYTEVDQSIEQIFNVFTIEQSGEEISEATYAALFDDLSYDSYIRGLTGTSVDNVVPPETRSVDIQFDLSETAPPGVYTLVIRSFDVTGIDQQDVSLADALGGVYPVLSSSSQTIGLDQAASTDVVTDLAGQESPSIACGSVPVNQLPSIATILAPGVTVETLDFDILLETNGGSWASEARIILGTTETRGIAQFNPGATLGEPTPPGGEQFTGSIDLVGAELEFDVGADGALWMSFCETFNDNADPDAFYLDPSTITTNSTSAPDGAARSIEGVSPYSSERPSSAR